MRILLLGLEVLIISFSIGFTTSYLSFRYFYKRQLRKDRELRSRYDLEHYQDVGKWNE